MISIMKFAVLVLLLVSQVTFGAKPNYTYHVRIDDPAEANYQEKQETRVLEKAQGSYSVLEPNGALRTVTYTADEEGFKPVITYSYGHPVAPARKVVSAAKVVAAPAPVAVAAPVIAQPIRQVVARPAVPLVVNRAPVVQKVVAAAPAAIAVPSGGYLPPPAAPAVVPSGGYSYLPPSKPFVAALPAPARVVAQAPIAVAAPAPVAVAAPVKKIAPIGGGYSYGISSADHYGLSYGGPGFTYSATRTYSHPPVVAAKVAQPVAVAPAPVKVAQPVAYAPARVQYAAAPQPIYQQVVRQQVYAAQAPVYAAQAPVYAAQAPVYAAQAPVYAAQAPVYAAQAPVYATAAKAYHTVQPAQLTFAAPAPLRVPVAAPTPIAAPAPIPQIAYGAPQFTLNSLSTAVAAAPAQVAYAPQHVAYAPAPVVKQVQLAQPQIQLAQLAQAQVNYVAQQPTVQLAAAPAPVPVAAPAPVYTQQVVQAAPVVQKQVVPALGNGVRISGNAFAVPAASGNKNPLTFEYSYGDGASKVSHSYSGSGW